MDSDTSLSQLIADGLVIQTEFSSPRKRQAHSTLQSSRRSRISRELPTADREYKSPIKDWKAHAQNYETVRCTAVSDHPTKPEINAQSKRLWRQWKDETVGDRMVRLEKERNDRQLLLSARKSAETAAMYDFHPKVNPGTQRKRSPDAVSLHLYKTGLKELRKKQQAGGSMLLEQFSSVRESVDSAAETHSKSPIRRELSLFSKAKMPLRDFLARNYWQPLQKLQKSTSPMRDLEDSECFFHPQINQSCVVSTNASSVFDRLTSRQRLSREKVYEKCRKLLETEASQCTFQPQLLRRSKTPPLPSDYVSKRVPLRTGNSTEKSNKEVAVVRRKDKVKYVDQRFGAYELKVGHCSGDWEVIESLEEVESKMTAFGLNFK